jgi:hypothetical protein
MKIEISQAEIVKCLEEFVSQKLLGKIVKFEEMKVEWDQQYDSKPTDFRAVFEIK